MSDKWIFSLPCPEFGEVAEGYYSAGGVTRCDDSSLDEESQLQIVSGVSERDYRSYIAALSDSGYEIEGENRLGDNLFADCGMYHISYFAAKGEMRVVLDKVKTPLSRLNNTKKGSGKTRVYQYGLYADPLNLNTDKTVNCGMMYVIKLSDNSLFMIDGGHIYQWNDVAMDNLWSFLRRISCVGEGEPVRIAAWFFTHAHDDHLDGCTKLLRRHGDDIILERVLHNFPSFRNESVCPRSVAELMRVFREKYPNAMYSKVHSGQEIILAGDTFEIYATHEDSVEKESIESFTLTSFNSTTTVTRFVTDGCSLMFLGDTGMYLVTSLQKITKREIWKSDAVQVAHHGINDLGDMYDWIAAPMALVPNSYYNAHTTYLINKIPQIVKNLSSEDNIFFAGDATEGFEVEGGKWVRVSSEPVVGGEYDGSGY